MQKNLNKYAMPTGRGSVTYTVNGSLLATTGQVCYLIASGRVFYMNLRDELVLWANWRELCALSDVVSVAVVGSESMKGGQ